MAATRRLAAVLAADLVGYSRIMGLDEEGTLVRLRALRAKLLDPKIAEHNGRLVKTTGDGFLVEFNSVIDALRCARDVQMWMAEQPADTPADRRFMLRIGVHQGDIVVEDGDIFGNGVNIAARLEGIAEPGGICVSERVQEDAFGRIDLAFEDMGEQQLKNIARPIRAYHVRITPAAPDVESPPVAQAVTTGTAEAETEASVESPPAPALAPVALEAPVLFPLLAADFEVGPEPASAVATSAEHLQSMISGWLDRPVQILQPPGAWVSLSPAERSRLPMGEAPGTLNRLGVDAAIGRRAWRSPAPMVVRIGPLDHESFEALLPDGPALQKLRSLLQTLLGPVAIFAINPILAGAELTPLRLAAENNAPLRLGWNTWMPDRAPTPGGAGIVDGDEALFASAANAGEAQALQPSAAAE